MSQISTLCTGTKLPVLLSLVSVIRLTTPKHYLLPGGYIYIYIYIYIFLVLVGKRKPTRVQEKQGDKYSIQSSLNIYIYMYIYKYIYSAVCATKSRITSTP